jgi:hypothetical protein
MSVESVLVHRVRCDDHPCEQRGPASTSRGDALHQAIRAGWDEIVTVDGSLLYRCPACDQRRRKRAAGQPWPGDRRIEAGLS